MKKLALTIAIVLGLGMTTFAENGGGLFQRGEAPAGLYGNRPTEGIMAPGLPDHGSEGNEPAPLGSGVVALLGLGAAYLVSKKRKDE